MAPGPRPDTSSPSSASASGSACSPTAINQSLWVPTLRHAFPRFDGRRTQLHADLERLRKLRNRTAHHEPIFARNLTIDHELVLDTIGYLEPQARTWTTTHSRVPAVIAERDRTVEGKRPTAF